MRGMVGLLGVILALAAIGLLAKKQFASIQDITVPTVAPAPGGTAASGAASRSDANLPQQSQQIQQQFKAAAEAAVQQARPMPEDKP
jgi:hypothetical protein